MRVILCKNQEIRYVFHFQQQKYTPVGKNILRKVFCLASRGLSCIFIKMTLKIILINIFFSCLFLKYTLCPFDAQIKIQFCVKHFCLQQNTAVSRKRNNMDKQLRGFLSKWIHYDCLNCVFQRAIFIIKKIKVRKLQTRWRKYICEDPGKISLFIYVPHINIGMRHT